MAVAKESKVQHQIPSGAAMAGILALLVDERETRIKSDKDAPKTEVLLANAGLSIEDIAAVMGKKYDAIRVSLSRSRSK
ncbi:MAG: hypothetical protein WD249_02185 [Gaiellaceae bacterium]